MARVDDGELYLEIEGATEGQLRRGLIAARKSLAEAGVDIRAAFAARERVERAEMEELGGENVLGDKPDAPSDEDEALFEALDEASWTAAVTAGFGPQSPLAIIRFGLVDDDQKPEKAPVVRDLFEPAE